ARVVDGDRSIRIRLGPSGPDYCIVQTPSGVCCLDPVTGAVRWQRRDIPPDSGLYANEETGLFGDAERLVLVEGDQRTCRILDTRTGEELRTATVPTGDVRRSRLAFGSRLLVIAADDEQSRFRLWDAATDEVIADIPAHHPPRSQRVDRNHAALVDGHGDVIVLDTRSGQSVLRGPIPPEMLTSLTGFKVWHDTQRWFVQTTHAGLHSGTSRTEPVASDVRLPNTPMNGLLSVYDRTRGSLLWNRPIDGRTMLQEPRRALPFLVALSRNREEHSTASAGMNLEVFDVETGLLLAQEKDLPRTEIVHSSFEPLAGEYTLHGEAMHFRIRFDLPGERALITAENMAEFADR
ncbi:MAG: PQQ-binding-like beta-propeller repeat protein, partial [Planctomycetaceae bacterium]|nr:PQQ-binding-like beta-propeller repeat protein [Planctomycetaceae bacterium]